MYKYYKYHNDIVISSCDKYLRQRYGDYSGIQLNAAEPTFPPRQRPGITSARNARGSSPECTSTQYITNSSRDFQGLDGPSLCVVKCIADLGRLTRRISQQSNLSLRCGATRNEIIKYLKGVRSCRCFLLPHYSTENLCYIIVNIFRQSFIKHCKRNICFESQQ